MMRRISSLYELKPRNKSFLFHRMFAVIGILLIAMWIVLLLLESAGLPMRLNAAAMMFLTLSIFGTLFGEGIAVGAFGQRFRGYGKTVWVYSQLLLMPLYPLIVAGMCYYFVSFGSGRPPVYGAVAGAVVGLIFSGWGVFDLYMKYRKRSDEGSELPTETSQDSSESSLL